MSNMCPICQSSMSYHFSKDFSTSCGFVADKGEQTAKVDYYRCENCGFCLSKTHAEMTPEVYTEVNYRFHSQDHKMDPKPHDPRWKERIMNQISLIHDLHSLGLLDTSKPWLDYACGDGFLANQLAAKYQLNLSKYDRYETNTTGYLTEQELKSKGFNFVITTSVFEHLTKREYFDEINSLVSDKGVMALHTMVRESIPPDPAWFYLLPVHCAFHTNKSMSILFGQWGYQCSIYHVESRIWFWFKTDVEKVEETVLTANKRPNAPHYIFKPGFVDYWKE